MARLQEAMPVLTDSLQPPMIHGVAELTTLAYQGMDFRRLMERINRTEDEVARLYDTAVACQLDFRRAEGLNLQDLVLEHAQMFRVRRAVHSSRPLRLLAIMGPGDLMVNTPLDFLTNYLDVRLDLLHLMPGRSLPAAIPDHDVAFFAISQADAPTQTRLEALFQAWPRPALNDPRFLPGTARDTLSQSLAGVPSICSPQAVPVNRSQIEMHLSRGIIIDGFGPAGPYPCLIRPRASHAGHGLAQAVGPADLDAYLRSSVEQEFYLTAFEDYASPDGLFRKSRIAFIDRRPFLCHLAISQNWMVHYLNAGMTESQAKRDEEAQAMVRFDNGFAHRHARAFAALHERLGFDFYSIDCAETKDGRLLVFEADAGAIIHMMDPEDLFPYKQSQMRRVFDAFGEMLASRARTVAEHG